MITNEWTIVEGFSNMGEADENIAARRTGDVVQVAYMAFSGIKVVELSGVEDIDLPVGASYLYFANTFGDDWEIGIYVKKGDEYVAVAIDSNSDVVSVDSSIECESSEEYDCDSVSELDEELLELYGLM